MKLITFVAMLCILLPLATAMTCESVNGSIICSQDISFAVTKDGQVNTQSVEIIPLAESEAGFDNSSGLPEKEFYSTKSSLIQVITVLIGISLLALSIYFYVKSAK